MILNRQRKVRVAIAPLDAFLHAAQREIGISGAEVAVCFVSNAEIAKLNQAYRKRHGPTDVLSFPAQASAAPRGSGMLCPPQHARRQASRFLGDIAISPETARKYAKRDNRRFPVELRILILHGLLHLLGYDHESDSGEMDRTEKRLRRRLGLE